MYSWPLNNVEVRGTDLHAVKNLCVTLDSPKTEQLIVTATSDHLLQNTIYWTDKLLTQTWFTLLGIVSGRWHTRACRTSNRRWPWKSHSSSTVWTTVNFIQLWFNTASPYLFTFDYKSCHVQSVWAYVLINFNFL